MSPQYAYSTAKPWIRWMIDRRIGWLILVAFALSLPLGLALGLAQCVAQAMSSTWNELRGFRSDVAGTWHRLRQACRYRRDDGQEGSAA